MSKIKIRSTRSVRPKSCAPETLPSNVVELMAFRDRRPSPGAHTVYYLNEAGRWLETLDSFAFLYVEDIGNMEVLKARLLSRTPDLIVLESELKWTDPVSTINLLSSLVEAPIVLITDCNAESSNLIKAAYAAGVHDTLYAPLREDELGETLEVLLKFRRQTSLNQ